MCHRLLPVCWALLFLAACQPANPPRDAVPEADETAEMVQRLQALVADGDPNLHYHWNRKLADALQAKMAAGEGTPQQQVDTWYAYCKQLLLAGEPQACIDQLEGYFAQSGQPYAEIIAGREQMFELLALAYLRLGEQENCQQAHTPYACILPLQAEGVHQLRRGSEKAAELYTLLLQHRRDPKNAWLLNLASMTLGEHPQGLPPQHRIDFPNWALEQRDFPRFDEVALHVGLAVDGLSGGCIVEDFDRDGWLDVFATSYGMEDQVKLFRNNGQGAFEDATVAAGLEGIVSGLNCLQADYDNDGWTDILILRGGWLGAGGHHPNSLLKNLGNGKFRDVTRSSGLLSLHPTQTAAWADFDRDGWLDLFIGNESTQGEQHACELYRNQGDGTFKEVADQHGLGNLHAFVKGVTWGDINNDGWPDLYVSVVDGHNHLYRNDQGIFTEIGAQAGVQEPFYSFPCWFWDANNDGFQDLFVGGYDLTNLDDLARDYARELIGLPVTTEKPRLYLNKGDGTFSDQTAAFGLSNTQYAMGANFGDLDNDGWLDYYAGTGAPDFSTVVPNRMFRNQGGHGFEEVTAAGNFGHIQKGHGIAFADLDRDGDQDIYQVMGGAYEGDNFTNILYENPISINRWIVIELVGTQSNRSAIGTGIELELDNGRKLYRTVGSGGSFGASSLQQEIGLGQAAQVNQLTVHWSNSPAQSFANVATNRKIRIREGNATPEVLDYQHMPFRSASERGHKH